MARRERDPASSMAPTTDQILRTEVKDLLGSPNLESMKNLISLLVPPPPLPLSPPPSPPPLPLSPPPPISPSELQENLREQQRQEEPRSLRRQEEDKERRHALRLYNYCSSNYPSALSLKLAHVAELTADDSIRDYAIFILRVLFQNQYRADRIIISPVIVTDIKPSVLSCLKRENSTTQLQKLARLVFFIVCLDYRVEGNHWTELRDYLCSAIDADVKKSLLICRDLLWKAGEEFFTPVFDKIYACMLQNLDSREEELWPLAFGAFVNFTGKMAESSPSEITESRKKEAMDSVKKLLREGNEAFLEIWLEYMNAWLDTENVVRIDVVHRDFLVELVDWIADVDGVGDDIVGAAGDASVSLLFCC